MKRKKPLVLIIEDDYMMAELHRDALKLIDIDSDIAKDGSAGYAMIQALQPDLIILDLMLPEIGGIEILESLQVDPVLKNIPVMVISVKRDRKTIGQCYTLGADSYFSKNEYQLELFLAEVEAILRSNK